MAETLTTYTELASVIEALPLLLRERRRQSGLSLRGAASEIGCAGTTVLRVEQGEPPSVENLVLILRWLDQTYPAKEDPK